MTANHTRLAALLLAILGAAALRLVPHPPNFSPIDAIALFSGAYVGRKWLAFAAPLGALLLSDLLLGFYSGMLFQYVSVALIVLLAMVALPRVTALRLGGAALRIHRDEQSTTEPAVSPLDVCAPNRPPASH